MTGAAAARLRRPAGVVDGAKAEVATSATATHVSLEEVVESSVAKFIEQFCLILLLLGLQE